MTYGEAWLLKKESAKAVNGEVVFDDISLPKRMKRRKALRYYTNKLNDYWLSKQLRAHGLTNETKMQELVKFKEQE